MKRGELRDALARARIHVERLEAAAQEGGPVERRHLAEAKAEMARARGRGGAREWAQAAAAWEAVERPYPAAHRPLARGRGAGRRRRARARPRERGRGGAGRRPSSSARAGWPSEIRALAERARLAWSPGEGAARRRPRRATGPPRAEDPFGLTPRERQVLALMAEGATNRQIGAALFMAEKTASVHVSRILSKLGVQGRTEAAAVAHRQHLA